MILTGTDFPHAKPGHPGSRLAMTAVAELGCLERRKEPTWCSLTCSSSSPSSIDGFPSQARKGPAGSPEGTGLLEQS